MNLKDVPWKWVLGSAAAGIVATGIGCRIASSYRKNEQLQRGLLLDRALLVISDRPSDPVIAERALSAARILGQQLANESDEVVPPMALHA